MHINGKSLEGDRLELFNNDRVILGTQTAFLVQIPGGQTPEILVTEKIYNGLDLDQSDSEWVEEEYLEILDLVEGEQHDPLQSDSGEQELLGRSQRQRKKKAAPLRIYDKLITWEFAQRELARYLRKKQEKIIMEKEINLASTNNDKGRD